MIVSLDGDTIATGAELAARMEQVKEVTYPGLQLTRERGEACINGAYELGLYQALRTVTSGTSRTIYGRYATQWRLDSAGVARISRLLVVQQTPHPNVRSVACKPLRSIRERRFMLVAMPLTVASFSEEGSQFRSAAAARGWVASEIFLTGTFNSQGRRLSPHPWPFSAMLGGRVRAREWWVDAVTQLVPARHGAHVWNSTYSSGLISTSSTQQHYVTLSRHIGPVRVGAGPVLLNSTWESSEEMHGDPDFWPSAVSPSPVIMTRKTMSAGGVLTANLAFDMFGGHILEIVTQYRFTPSVSIGANRIFPGGKVRQNALTIGTAWNHAF